jgi:hypothetical protein
MNLLLPAVASIGLVAQTPIQFAAKDATLKLGFLAKPAFEAVGNATKEGTTQNFFVRQIRIMAGGTLGENFEFFFETDSPNLGKANADGTKANGPLVMQDAAFTYKLTKKIRIDAGLLLVPLSHNSTQGAGNLNTWDYSAYAFLQNAGMGSSTGRDTGVQVRGVVGAKEGNLEFRVGAYQGKRLAASPVRPQSNNALRVAGFARWNFFEAENGLFLGGTYLGTKKVLSVGLGFDRQDDYRASSLDVFMDLPLGTDGISGQWNHVAWDGKTWLPTLVKQTTDFAEFGYRFGTAKLSPMLRFESRKVDKPSATNPDETRLGLGLAWWFKGHQSNLKAFYTKVEPKAPGVTSLRSYDQVNLQWQWLLY